LDRSLRALTAIYGLVFLASCLQNFGLRLSFGPMDFYFSEPIWQAGAGEAVIGVLLVAAAVREGRALYWTAYVLSVLGIAFGLSSARVVEAAREIHFVLVPLAAIGLAMLAWRRIRRT
jgi:asparagine N-glycosylation enzyme membrane subunit Stt3